MYLTNRLCAHSSGFLRLIDNSKDITRKGSIVDPHHVAPNLPFALLNTLKTASKLGTAEIRTRFNFLH